MQDLHEAPFCVTFALCPFHLQLGVISFDTVWLCFNIVISNTLEKTSLETNRVDIVVMSDENDLSLISLFSPFSGLHHFCHNTRHICMHTIISPQHIK